MSKLFTTIILLISIANVFGQAGSDCTTPITASVGLNFASNYEGDQWHSFTPTETGFYTFSTLGLTEEDTDIVIYAECDGDIFASNDDYSSLGNGYQTYLSVSLEANVSYYINWSGDNNQSSYFWTLTEGHKVAEMLTLEETSAQLVFQEEFGVHSIDLNELFSEYGQINNFVVEQLNDNSNSVISSIVNDDNILLLTERDGMLGTEMIFIRGLGEDNIAFSHVFEIVVIENIEKNNVHYVHDGVFDIELPDGYGEFNIPVDRIFADEENDDLVYTVELSDSSLFDVEIRNTNLFLSPNYNIGQTTVTITATDYYGRDVSSSFDITIRENNRPIAVNMLNELILTQGFGTRTLNLNDMFQDPDGDELSFEISTMLSRIELSLSNDNFITISELDYIGAERIYIDVTDGILSSHYSIPIFIVLEDNTPTISENYVNVINLESTDTIIVLSDYFIDEDGDDISFSIMQNADNVHRVSINNEKLRVSLSSEEVGISFNLLIGGSDLKGGDAHSFFIFNLNADENTAPVVNNRPRNISLTLRNNESFIALNNIFEDEDGDSLVYTYFLSNENVIELDIDNDTLYIEGIGHGTTSLFVRAYDENGGVADFEINVSFQRSTSDIENVKSNISKSKVYPTIVNNNISVVANIGDLIEIYSSMGKKYYSATAKSNVTEINISECPSALYFVLVEGKKHSIIKK